MAYQYILLLAIAASVIVSAAFVVVSKRILHAVAALTLVFVESALIFLYLDQVLLAMLQLLIFVGGLSTYLIVAIAAEEHINKMENVPLFIIISILLFAGASTMLLYLNVGATAGPNSITAAAVSVFQGSYSMLYLAVFLLFAGAIGSAIIARRFVKLVM